MSVSSSLVRSGRLRSEKAIPDNNVVCPIHGPRAMDLHDGLRAEPVRPESGGMRTAHTWDEPDRIPVLIVQWRDRFRGSYSHRDADVVRTTTAHTARAAPPLTVAQRRHRKCYTPNNSKVGLTWTMISPMILIPLSPLATTRSEHLAAVPVRCGRRRF